MYRKKIRIVALVIAVMMLFSGCSYIAQMAIDHFLGGDVVAYQDMEYVRPDLTEFSEVLEETCRLAEEETDIDKVLDGVYRFYEVYDWFYTCYFLADIRYSGDLTDYYWEQEYQFCLENTAQVDAGLEQLYRALAQSPIREELEGEDYFGPGFFDSYEGDPVWDEEYMAFMEQEAALQSRYYELSAQAMDVEYYSEEYFSVYGAQMEELFVELIALRQEIAAYMGYDSYPEFASQMYHARDYTAGEAEAYLLEVEKTLIDSYQKINVSNVWEKGYTYCTERETFRYVKTAAENMGGITEEAFSLLETADLYDIEYGSNKASGAFEVYLWSYYEPFIFLSPYLDQSDKLSFAHEFGHFVSDYVCYGSAAGTDVAEVHSQAMEYLSLLYGEDTEDLAQYKMADSLCTYVEQAAYALFEIQVYSLEGEELTAENVRALYEDIGTRFGFGAWGWDSRDYVAVDHFFTDPMYIISYVVSNDVALQIYQLEKEETGAGLEVFQQCVESGDSYLLRFAETYGLESPFAPGRLEEVRRTLEEELAPYLR